MTTNQTSAFYRICPPAAEERLSLKSLFDPEAVTSILEDRLSTGNIRITKCDIKYVRYHPARFAIVSYEIEYVDLLTGRTLNTEIYAACSESDRWEGVKTGVVGRNKWMSGALGLSYFLAQDLRTIFLEFPNDLEIPGLTILADTQELAQVLPGVRSINGSQAAESTPNVPHLNIAKYKPENRCILRGQMPVQAANTEEAAMAPVIVRFDKVTNHCAAFELMRNLHLFFAAHPTTAVPRVYFCDEARQLSVVEMVAGCSLSDLLAGEDVREQLSSTIQGLAAFHNYRNGKLPQRDATMSLRRAYRQAELVGMAGSEYRRQVSDILRQLQLLNRETPVQSFGLVHGDFHPGQVICNGDRNWFIDFHRSHYGETAADLGNLFAQLRLARIKSQTDVAAAWEPLCLEVYEQASAGKTSRERIRFWTVIGLLELGAKQYRGLKRSWPERLAKILRECQNVLDS